jgi:hypothetical protein
MKKKWLNYYSLGGTGPHIVVGLIKRGLQLPVFNLFLTKKSEKMLKQTRNVVSGLRAINKMLDNTKRIDSWMEEFLEKNLIENSAVTIITPWSLSKSFEKRFHIQGQKFTPTRREIKLFQKEIPYIQNLFEENSFNIGWFICLSRSYLNSRLLPKFIEEEYSQMVNYLADKYNFKGLILNWEDDVIKNRHQANILVFENFNSFVSNQMFETELLRWKTWAKENDILLENIINETKYQISCEAEEGRFFMESKDNPLHKPGEFLFFPLGRCERYDTFSLLNPEFSKRLISVLKYYPWRL